MVKAILSYWSAPRLAGLAHGWAGPLSELCAWVLSTELAKQHYNTLEFVTDEWGKAFFVDKIGLRFDKVTTILEILPKELSRVWSLGKLVSYQIQEEPFIELDYDVFLWEKPYVGSKPLFCQSPEVFELARANSRHYRVDLLTPHLKFIPEIYQRGMQLERFSCCNVGIFGGSDLDFIKEYATQAIDLVLHPLNREGWLQFCKHQPLICAVIAEQWMLGAAVASKSREIAYLFPAEKVAYDQDYAAKMGYTHLLGYSKRKYHVCRKLISRVARDYPDLFLRCKETVGERELMYAS